MKFSYHKLYVLCFVWGELPKGDAPPGGGVLENSGVLFEIQGFV